MSIYDENSNDEMKWKGKETKKKFAEFVLKIDQCSDEE